MNKTKIRKKKKYTKKIGGGDISNVINTINNETAQKLLPFMVEMKNNFKNIFITGGAVFIGSHISEAFFKSFNKVFKRLS